MAKPKRKKRTSIRTAAGVAQDKYLERVRVVAAEPHRILPECPEGEAKAIAKLHAGIDKLAAGKVGFFDKRDKGMLGAAIFARSFAELEAVPRLLDTRVAGKRRFFLTRGHVNRMCHLAVQNHDDPRTLLMGYRDMAKEAGLHFFAADRLMCSGDAPRPPQEWVDLLAKDAGATAGKTDDGWRIGGDGDAVRLHLRGGPTIDVAPIKGEQMHKHLTARYAGPQRRHPVDITILLAGKEQEPDREGLAAYRAGVIDEKGLLDKSR